ncbi:hypothetical protein M1349_05765 [Patescibacteria group bacterium]|nr:hypothetical protein [Patescibacteria group bacterium]
MIKRDKKSTKSASITNVFINIPIPMEKPTNPSLYSFFQGLKYVLTRRGNDRTFKILLFNDEKNKKTDNGISKNQNFRKTNGSSK